MPSLGLLVSILLSSFVSTIYFFWLFNKTEVSKITFWRYNYLAFFLLNVVAFASIVYYFNSFYGFVTDDINYYYGAMLYKGRPIWEVKGGNEFMFFLVKPFRDIFDLDRFSFHALFAGLGFIGSMNFLYIATQRGDFLNSLSAKYNRLVFFIILCFPNFMFWGRVFGKDSTMLFLASFFSIAASKLLVGAKNSYIFIIPLLIFIYLMQILRPHIAGVLGISFMIAYIYRSFRIKQANAGLGALIKLYIPAVAIVIAFIFVISSIQRLGVEQGDISADAIKETIISATQMGAYGGSTTDLATEMKDNPDIIFNPVVIAKNIFNLFFSPLPWQVRGGADLIAFVSNILLFYLLYRFIRKVKIYDEFQVFLFVATVGLSLLLSFMTGNIGLILRQKTIILPFLFLLLFSRSPEELAVEIEHDSE
jgi:hypothetical protein